MPDLNILTLAVREERMVVTMDKDFGKLVYRSRQPHTGVLLLRLEAARSDEKVAVVEEIFRKYEKQLLGNKLCGCQGVVGSVIPPNGVEDVNKPIHDGDDRLLVRLTLISMTLIDGMEVVIVANRNLTG